jgi:hypothetical protein
MLRGPRRRRQWRVMIPDLGNRVGDNHRSGPMERVSTRIQGCVTDFCFPRITAPSSHSTTWNGSVATTTLISTQLPLRRELMPLTHLCVFRGENVALDETTRSLHTLAMKTLITWNDVCHFLPTTYQPPLEEAFGAFASSLSHRPFSSGQAGVIMAQVGQLLNRLHTGQM